MYRLTQSIIFEWVSFTLNRLEWIYIQMSDGIKIGETMLVVLAITALLLSAAFLPVIDVFDGGGVPDAGLGSGIGEKLGGEDAWSDIGDIDGIDKIGDSGRLGSPASTSLTDPPEETAIGGGRESGGAVESAPLFVAESSEDTYWRQSAYTSYTGTGWERSADEQPIDQGVLDDDRTGANQDSIEYEVTLLTESRSLPTAWEPESVELDDQSTDTEITKSTVGGVRSEQPLPEGSTYVAESSVPTRDPDILRQADGTAPAEIHETYTQLPSETPSRVEEFTDDLVADEETKYDTAMTVQNWLKSNKGYSLQTPLDPNEPVADQLIFEVDEAYCQQFATTMAAMLRSQDIPARYVVGFAGGQSVGGEEYLVTSDRAHAWVEVYFEDVGWVRFEPTPAGELPVETPQPPYDISLNRSAVVGAPVTVSVEKDGSGVSRIPVYVNGERVGWSDRNGELTTTLPYAEEITVTARPPGSETKYTDGSETRNEEAQFSRSVEPLASSAPLALSQVGMPLLKELPTGLQTQGDTSESSETYTADTNAKITVLGDPTVGSTVEVVVTVQDVPVTDATVRLDGETVGTTDSEGSYELSLANVAPGTHQLTASRDVVETSTEVTVTASGSESDPPNEGTNPLEPNVSVSPSLIALPGGSATATVERDGNPVAGTAVRVDGTIAGRTDANGTVDISFPITGGVVVATSVNGVTGERSVQGLYRNAVAVFVVFGVAVVGVAVVARRRGITLQLLKRKLAVVGGLIATIPRRLTTLLVRLATLFETVVRGGWQQLGAVLRDGLSKSFELLRGLDPRWLLTAAVAWVIALFRAENATESSSGTKPSESEPTDSVDRRRIRTIWSRFISIVRPPKLTTRTPGEIGRYAINRGLPQQPVQYLTELYRAVEYGRHEPDASRIETAQDALSTVEKQEDDDGP